MRENTVAFLGLLRDIVAPVCPETTARPPPGRTYPPHPGGFLIRCPTHLNWHFSMWRSSGFTLRPSQLTKIFTLSLRASPAALLRELISPACIHHLILLLVTNKRVRWGLKSTLLRKSNFIFAILLCNINTIKSTNYVKISALTVTEYLVFN